LAASVSFVEVWVLPPTKNAKLVTPPHGGVQFATARLTQGAVREAWFWLLAFPNQWQGENCSLVRGTAGKLKLLMVDVA